MANSIAQEYDAIAASYDKLTTSRLYDELIIDALPERCERVVDIGCGTGALTQKLSQRCREVIAADVSIQMLQAARSRSYSGTVLFHQVPAENIGQVAEAGSCDAIVANRVLHHVTDLDQLGTSIGSLLRPGGRLVVLDLARTGRFRLPLMARAFEYWLYVAALLLKAIGSGHLVRRLRDVVAERRFSRSSEWQRHISNEPDFTWSRLVAAMRSAGLHVCSRRANVRFRFGVATKREA